MGVLSVFAFLPWHDPGMSSGGLSVGTAAHVSALFACFAHVQETLSNLHEGRELAYMFIAPTRIMNTAHDIWTAYGRTIARITHALTYDSAPSSTRRRRAARDDDIMTAVIK